MSRKTRIVLTFALAVLLPGTILATLAFRALRAEESLRRNELEEQARQWVRLRARELGKELDERVSRERQRLALALQAGGEYPTEVIRVCTEPGDPVWPAAHEPMDLGTALFREREELAHLLRRAEAVEFEEGSAAGAIPVYQEVAAALEHPMSRARVQARIARCALKSGDTDLARSTLLALANPAFADAPSEVGLPIGIGARLQLLALAEGAERARYQEELLQAAADPRLDPGWVLFVLGRLGADTEAARGLRERADVSLRALAWTSQPRAPEDVLWVAGGSSLWAAIAVPFVDAASGEGRWAVAVLRTAPEVLAEARTSLEAFARAGGMVVGMKRGEAWEGAPVDAPDTEIAVASGTLRVVGRLERASRDQGVGRSFFLLAAGLIALPLVAMLIGLWATLRAVNRELETARLKSEFVAGVSHELRTPLTSIRMFADLLAGDGAEDAEKRRVHIDIIRDEASRLSRLMESLLDFSRLERGNASLRVKAMDLREIVRRAVESYRPSRPGFGLSLSVPDTEVRARIDPVEIERALHNLFDNAVKYCPEQETASVSLRTAEGHARIDVADQGPGIDAQDLPHLFEMFYRGHDPLVLDVPGTGLGLATVRRIAAAHGGRADVESAPGRGSTFSIEIPLCRESSS